MVRYQCPGCGYVGTFQDFKSIYNKRQISDNVRCPSCKETNRRCNLHLVTGLSGRPTLSKL